MNPSIFCLQARVGLLLLIACACIAPPSHAAAFCALRDPTTSIYDLFPSADNYRSSVRTIGRVARTAVIEELPFSLHFNELGRHTLYIALQNEQVAGYVHSRSEQGEWGITEYVWAITPDGKIEDVRIQRSRDPYVRGVSREQMSALVRGKSLKELKHAYFQLMSKPLEKSLLASAMKTLVITTAVWSDELEASKAQLSGVKPALKEDTTSLDVARMLDSAAHSVKRISPLYDPSIQNNLKKVGISESPAFERLKNIGYLVGNREGAGIGLLIRTPFSLAQPERFLWWYVSYEGNIRGVIDEYTMQHDRDFDSVVGTSPYDIQNCNTLADLAALEIAVLSKHYF